MIRIPFFLRIAKIVVCTVTTIPVFAQDHLPSIPQTEDPSVWGRPNEPYALTLTETNDIVTAMKTRPHISQEKLYRDSIGRERTEVFYDNGQLAEVMIRDPRGNSTTFLKVVVLNVVEKTATVYSTPRSFPPPRKGWSVQRLQPRVIAGFPAEGLRFTANIPTVITRVPSTEFYETVMEEYWISNELGVVLEQTSENPRSGKTTKTVTRLQRVEPDPALFVIPSGYSVRQFLPLD